MSPTGSDRDDRSEDLRRSREEPSPCRYVRLADENADAEDFELEEAGVR
jgi:hypothetical protein